MGAKPIPAKNRAKVTERSGGICEGCGLRPATEVHHRQYLSRGGKHDVGNLIHLCGMGNGSGCHGIAHSSEGHELGWSVNSWSNPLHVPVLRRGVLVWLTNDGRNPDIGQEVPF